MELAEGTKSSCRNCGATVEWRHLSSPTVEQAEAFREEHGSLPSNPRWYGAVGHWRHMGSTWYNPMFLCLDNERHQDLQEVSSYDRDQAEKFSWDMSWYKTRRYADPVDYCTKEVEFRGEYGTCNRKAKKEDPHPELCGLHLKPVVQEELEREEQRRRNLQMENERAIRELFEAEVDRLAAKIPIPGGKVHVRGYSRSGKIEEYEYAIPAKVIFQHFGIPLPGEVVAEDEDDFLPEWARGETFSADDMDIAPEQTPLDYDDEEEDQLGEEDDV